MRGRLQCRSNVAEGKNQQCTSCARVHIPPVHRKRLICRHTHVLAAIHPRANSLLNLAQFALLSLSVCIRCIYMYTVVSLVDCSPGASDIYTCTHSPILKVRGCCRSVLCHENWHITDMKVARAHCPRIRAPMRRLSRCMLNGTLFYSCQGEDAHV